MFFFTRNAMISKRKVMKKISFLDHKNYSKKKRIVQSYNCNTDTVQCTVRSVLFNHNADTDIHSVQSDPDPHHWFFQPYLDAGGSVVVVTVTSMLMKVGSPLVLLATPLPTVPPLLTVSYFLLGLLRLSSPPENKLPSRNPSRSSLLPPVNCCCLSPSLPVLTTGI